MAVNLVITLPVELMKFLVYGRSVSFLASLRIYMF